MSNKKQARINIYASQEEVINLQRIAKRLGFVAKRGASAPHGGGSASELVRAIANLPESKLPELAELLGISKDELFTNEEYG